MEPSDNSPGPDPKIARLVPKPGLSESVHQQVLALAREVLQATELGEVETLLVIVKHKNGTWSTHQSAVVDFAQAIGWLEVLKVGWIEAFRKAMAGPGGPLV